MIRIIVIISCLCILSLPNLFASQSDLILIHVVSSFPNRKQPIANVDHIKKRPEAYSTDLSRTIAGQEDNAGISAHSGTSVFALGWQL